MYIYYYSDYVIKTPLGYPCLSLLNTLLPWVPLPLLSLVLSLREQSKNQIIVDIIWLDLCSDYLYYSCDLSYYFSFSFTVIFYLL